MPSALLIILLLAVFGASYPIRIYAGFEKFGKVHVVAGIIIFSTIALLIRKFVFHDFLTTDEFVYNFQAQTYLHGRAWNPAPPLGQAMNPQFIALADGKWFGMYPPGWPLILMSVFLLHLPPEVCIIGLIASVVWLLSMLLADVGEGSSPALGLAMLITAPFTLFNGATLYAHMESCVFVLLAALAARRALDRRLLRWAILAGIALGMLGISRSLSAIVVAIPIALAILLSGDRVKLGLGLAIGGAPFAAILLFYQKVLTGSPFKSPYWLAGRSIDHLYFDPHSIFKGMILTVKRLAEISLWTTPILILLVAAALLIKARGRKLDFVDFIFPSAVIGYIFYPLSPISQYGPRYLFEFWPVAIVAIISALPVLGERYRAHGRALLLLSCVYGLVLTPFLVGEYGRLFQYNIQARPETVARQIGRAILCIRPAPATGYNPGVRNDINLSAPILETDCSKVSVTQVSAAFPDRAVWIYDAAPFPTPGRLRLFAPARNLAVTPSDAFAPAPSRPTALKPVERGGAAEESGLIGRLVSWIIDVIGATGYLGVMALMAIESACVPMPSEVIMPFAGYLVYLGKLNLIGVATAGALGCNIGSAFAYYAGAYGGRAFVRRWGKWLLLSGRDLDRAEAFFERYGSSAVFFGRLLPVIRTFIAFPAGMARMNLLKFHVYTFLGSWPWCLALAWIGMRLGDAWNSDPRLKTILHSLDAVIILAVVLAIALFVWRHLREMRQEGFR